MFEKKIRVFRVRKIYLFVWWYKEKRVSLRTNKKREGIMNTAALEQNYTVNSYWMLLKGLSDNVKLALIGKLASSLAKSEPEGSACSSPLLSDFCGSLADVPFPSTREIEQFMSDEDKDISQLCL